MWQFLKERGFSGDSQFLFDGDADAINAHFVNGSQDDFDFNAYFDNLSYSDGSFSFRCVTYDKTFLDLYVK